MLTRAAQFSALCSVCAAVQGTGHYLLYLWIYPSQTLCELDTSNVSSFLFGLSQSPRCLWGSFLLEESLNFSGILFFLLLRRSHINVSTFCLTLYQVIDIWVVWLLQTVLLHRVMHKASSQSLFPGYWFPAAVIKYSTRTTWGEEGFTLAHSSKVHHGGRGMVGGAWGNWLYCVCTQLRIKTLVILVEYLLFTQSRTQAWYRLPLAWSFFFTSPVKITTQRGAQRPIS